MLKKIAWDTFKNTGDINTFLEFKQIEKIENELNFDKNTNNNYNNINNLEIKKEKEIEVDKYI